MAAGETNWNDAALLTAAFVATAVGLYGAQGVLDYFDISGLSGIPGSVFAAPFGLLVGVALFESWRPAIGLAVVSIPAFWSASQLTGELAQARIPLLAGFEEGFAFLIGSLLGTMIMAAALTYWHRRAASQFVFAPLMGAIAALAFVNPWLSNDWDLLTGFIVWQVLVGWALVGGPASSANERPVRNRRIIAISAFALIIGSIGLALVPPSTEAGRFAEPAQHAK
jgi:hypothetical protein